MKIKKKLIIYSVAVVAVIVVIIIAIQIVKSIKQKIEAKKRQEEMEKDADLAEQNRTITLTTSQAQAIADSLKEAFGMWGWSTDENAVYNAFDSVSTVGDIYLVMKKFGTHKDHTLTEWINKEFDNDEKTLLNRQLTDKNIDYKF